ncbi:MAG: SRPBCC family protein [Pseudonocardiaceae bacterium]
MGHEVTVEIDATPEQVWSVLEDVERWPRWSPTMTSGRRLDDGPFGRDSTAEVRQPRLPKNAWRVSRFEPGRRFEWVTSAPGVTIRADHRIVALANHRSRVTLTIAESGVLSRLIAPLSGPFTHRYLTLEAAGLKKRCEADPQHSTG